MKTNEERLQDMMDYVDSLTRINPSDIPSIDLYMDQVTTFMDSRLASSKRFGEEKILTKTMINNYAKNNLLPPPEKKKYSKNHILMLVLIYYFKNVLSFNDIEQLFAPISENHFADGSRPELTELYNEIFSLEREQRKRLKEDVMAKFQAASATFRDVDTSNEEQTAGQDDETAGDTKCGDVKYRDKKDGDGEYLRLFAFICELAFDVYLKKQMIELVATQLREENPPSSKKKK